MSVTIELEDKQLKACEKLSELTKKLSEKGAISEFELHMFLSLITHVLELCHSELEVKEHSISKVLAALGIDIHVTQTTVKSFIMNGEYE